ncbi:hypothetical protein LOAG_09833 [Loa loa]|uniref:Uncharacterized protein n=1 Tax=Loa loa TaxID=7209 RepID=A0A1S0TSB2_LOALO|nr:hypothetical protein LOAG_09833 [Loa loa]EFO18661.1 hypothetical protein LOAG_09833 [Loa loa]
MSQHIVLAINVQLFPFSTLIYLEKHLLDLYTIFKQQAETQTEQTELLDLPVPKLSEERNAPIGLPMQGISGEIEGCWNEGSKRYREFMNLPFEEESVE